MFVLFSSDYCYASYNGVIARCTSGIPIPTSRALIQDHNLPKVAAPVLRILATLADAVCCIKRAELCSTNCSIPRVIPNSTSLHTFMVNL